MSDEQLAYYIDILLQLRPCDLPPDASEGIKRLVAIAHPPEPPRLRLVVDNTKPA